MIIKKSQIFNFHLNFIYLISFSLILMPFFLISGPFLPDLTVVICAIFAIYLFFKSGKSLFDIHPYLFIFFIWCIYLIIVSLSSIYPYKSLESSLFYFRFGLFACCIYYVINNYENFLKYFTISILISFLILFIDGILQFYLGFNSIGMIKPSSRVSSFFGEELKLGSYIARLSPLLFGLIIFLYGGTIKKIGFYLIILLIIVNILTFISGERAAFLYIVFLDLFLIFFIKSINIYLRKNYLLITSFVILISLSLGSSPFQRMFKQTMDNFNSNNQFFIFSESHHNIYMSAIEIYKEKIYFGIGPKNYRNYCVHDKYSQYFEFNQGECFSHPHNNYLQILLETGVFSFIFFIIIFGLFIFYFLKNSFAYFFSNSLSYVKEYKLLLFLSIFITLFPFIPTSNFFNNWISVIYFLPVGFYFAIKES